MVSLTSVFPAFCVRGLLGTWDLEALVSGLTTVFSRQPEQLGFSVLICDPLVVTSIWRGMEA